MNMERQMKTTEIMKAADVVEPTQIILRSSLSGSKGIRIVLGLLEQSQQAVVADFAIQGQHFAFNFVY